MQLLGKLTINNAFCLLEIVIPGLVWIDRKSISENEQVSFTLKLLYLTGKSLRYPLDTRLFGNQSRSSSGEEELYIRRHASMRETRT